MPQTLRSELHGNSTQSPLAWAYELDLRLRVPENPDHLKALRRPLHQNTNVAADLFEAHLGALAEEDRESEIVEWVASLLERNMAKVRQRVADLLDRTKAIDRSFKTPLPTDNAKKKDVSKVCAGTVRRSGGHGPARFDLSLTRLPLLPRCRHNVASDLAPRGVPSQTRDRVSQGGI